MNDRELLELAAKAIHLPENYANDAFMRGFYSNWNPLTDDGDALRLAVKLALLVDCDYSLGVSAAIGRRMPTQVVKHDGAPYAATRRAIVLAAAEIGRSMND